MEIADKIPRFRELHDLLIGYKGNRLYEAVLQPWSEKAQVAVSGVDRFRTMSRYDTKSDEFLLPIWNLYALSRVNDFLLLSFQNDERGNWTGPQVSEEQYLAFFSQLGFTPFVSGGVSSFRNEIVRVQQSHNEAEPVTMTTMIWPGLMFGEMLFSRSGVAVVGGRHHVVKEVAETSTLYFTYRRLHRKTSDLSMGWGSNSQWRTAFRRDYECHRMRFYNIDGGHCLNHLPSEADRDGLTINDRIELCKNRCVIVTTKRDDDLWPFGDCYQEPLSR